MMSGSKFYRQSPNLLNNFEHAAPLLGKKAIDHTNDFSLENEWEMATKEVNRDFYRGVEINGEVAAKNKAPVNNTAKTSESRQEIRMQEIEEYILHNSIIKSIQGNLCIWNGHYYKQLNLALFTQEVRKILPKSSQSRISRFSRFKEAYEYMQANAALAHFEEKDISKAQNMIVFRNGIYDGKTHKLFSSTPCYPVLFDINATYIGDSDMPTPYFDKLINKATRYDKEVLELCYQVLGYIFSQGIQAKKFFLLGTAPDSGKSVIGEFMAKILGSDNISSIALNDLGSRFALGTINQKVLNFNMDLPATELDRNSIQKLKLLTGDPRIDCEEKYVQSKTVMHHCKFLFATNHPIRLKYEDEAFYRRLVLVPFIYSVDEADRDYDLLEKLWQERDAIATKAAHAYTRLLENNYVFQKSSLAYSMLCEWQEQDNDNLLIRFFEEKCELTDEKCFTATDIVFNQFKQYCQLYGQSTAFSEKAQFSKKFRTLFGLKMDKRRVSGYTSPVNGYLGLKIFCD